jgi:hypothetical protein
LGRARTTVTGAERARRNSSTSSRETRLIQSRVISSRDSSNDYYL